MQALTCIDSTDIFSGPLSKLCAPNELFCMVCENTNEINSFKKFNFFLKIQIDESESRLEPLYTQMCAETCVPSDKKQDTFEVRCCQKNDCNQVIIRGMVKSCYVGGYSSLLQPDGLGVEIPVTKKKCISPKNQFCISTEAMVEARDDFMIVSKGCSGKNEISRFLCLKFHSNAVNPCSLSPL